ncbi:DegT/DnrJ/EryC1/StrS family aminotransferase [Bythopirellula goksoeyrii]|uniref:Aminotransferase n=1 Tax=Bythopirellula goksoeyrii TaxID=1400387 RepID=A0A5B9Q2S5_9BACT|nr:DegT/DnrJ/EryC1/StrS family aminotransferase [Bythopirellula goksoeyrii]QEG33284.1 Aminotransferase [Bythopirellula goksoeyrii]
MASPTVASTPVPMLDVNRQNAPLQDEIQVAIAEVCASGAFVHGPACQEFEDAVARYCGVQHAVGCASGSDALLLALMALEIGPGDEVVLPSFTFFATASAVTRLGATPVFADILPATFNIDPDDVMRKISPRTKAILPVHLFGQCADMEAIKRIAHEAGELPVIEDAAQAIGAEFAGRRAGSLGTVGCFSFYPTKNLGGVGDGGMLTTNDDRLASRLRILRDHGQHPRYHHSLVGLNSRLDSLQAAVLSVKLKRLDDWAESRRSNAERYRSELGRCGLAKSLTLPEVAPNCSSVWNQYTVRVGDGQRDALQKHLAAKQIGSAVYYPIPLHLQECFSSLGYQRGTLPMTEQACQEVLSLPIYGELTEKEQNQVITALAKFFGIAAAVTSDQCAA